MRLFIAINFTAGTRAKIAALRDELRERSKRGNFSLDENLHLTLAFLGECDAGQAAAAKSAMDEAAFKPFGATVERVGRFRRDGGDIWWAGLRADAGMSELQRNLTGGLASAGFTLDTRKFSPHITLGREVVTSATPRNIEPFGETVAHIELMKSERISGKLTYTAIYSVVSTI